MDIKIGSYKILRQISEGAFGRTYLGEHLLLRVPACVKQEKTGLPEYMKLFRDEARLLAKLHHEGLPGFQDYYEDADFGQAIVMSFVEGESLHGLTQKGGYVDDEHICWIVQRLLEILTYMHYLGVVHCDIKPENVLLKVQDHQVVLVDFGLCAVRPDAASLPKGGTEHYLPPEFLVGTSPVPASDLYSLGKTAVFMAGGDIRTGTLPADMRPELKSLIARLIRRDPDARPQSAAETHRELLAVRRKAFGRTESREMFKYRQ